MLARLVCGCTVLVLLAIARPAGAAVVVALSLDDLVVQADAIVHGRVVDATSRWQGRLIVTDVSLEVLGAPKGVHRPGERVALLQPGGKVGDLGMSVPGAATFAVGEEVLVFLEEVRQGPPVVLGLAQGKFEVEPSARGPLVTRDLRGLTLFHPGVDPAEALSSPVSEPPVALAPLLRALRDRESAP